MRQTCVAYLGVPEKQLFQTRQTAQMRQPHVAHLVTKGKQRFQIRQTAQMRQPHVAHLGPFKEPQLF